LLTYKIPVFSLQFLIENALKHNTFTVTNPIKINIESENNILIVSNTKHDASEINTAGVGLNNLKTRYKLLIGKEIEIINNPEFFKVFLSLSK
jgi:LytS/YehU family sensor histidine kinase